MQTWFRPWLRREAASGVRKERNGLPRDAPVYMEQKS